MLERSRQYQSGVIWGPKRINCVIITSGDKKHYCHHEAHFGSNLEAFSAVLATKIREKEESLEKRKK